jgi:hypothetical protein
MSKLSIALRRPAVRRILSRACANLLAVAAITTIFALKALIDMTTPAEAAAFEQPIGGPR